MNDLRNLGITNFQFPIQVGTLTYFGLFFTATIWTRKYVYRTTHYIVSVNKLNPSANAYISKIRNLEPENSVFVLTVELHVLMALIHSKLEDCSSIQEVEFSYCIL